MKEKIIKLARDEIGYLEKSKENYSLYGSECLYPKTKYAGADNYTKYSWELRNAGLGHPNGQPWCETFISYIFWKAAGAEEADRLASQCRLLCLQRAHPDAGRHRPQFPVLDDPSVLLR